MYIFHIYTRVYIYIYICVCVYKCIYCTCDVIFLLNNGFVSCHVRLKKGITRARAHAIIKVTSRIQW